MPVSLVSVSSIKGLVQSGIAKIGAVVRLFLSWLKACPHSSVHLNGFLHSVVWYKLLQILDKVPVKLAKPKNWTSWSDCGMGQSLIFDVLKGSGNTPLNEAIWPRKFTSLWRKWHLIGCILRPTNFKWSKTCCRRQYKYSSKDLPIIITSSI